MFSKTCVNPTLPPGSLALTFDDGPGPHTLQVASLLSRHSIRATFFFVGKHVLSNRRIVREVKSLGHAIGNHTHTHKNLPQISPNVEVIVSEVLQAHRLISDCIGEQVRYFRAPWGAWSPAIADQLNSCQELTHYVGPVHWTVSHKDFQIGGDIFTQQGISTYRLDECLTNYTNDIRRQNGGVILLHDWSADEGPLGEKLRANNRSVELTELLILRFSTFRFLGVDEIATV